MDAALGRGAAPARGGGSGPMTGNNHFPVAALTQGVDPSVTVLQHPTSSHGGGGGGGARSKRTGSRKPHGNSSGLAASRGGALSHLDAMQHHDSSQPGGEYSGRTLPSNMQTIGNGGAASSGRARGGDSDGFNGLVHGNQVGEAHLNFSPTISQNLDGGVGKSRHAKLHAGGQTRGRATAAASQTGNRSPSKRTASQGPGLLSSSMGANSVGRTLSYSTTSVATGELSAMSGRFNRQYRLPVKRAVVIGINYLSQFADRRSEAELLGPSNDAHVFALTLINNLEFHPKDILLLVDALPAPCYRSKDQSSFPQDAMAHTLPHPNIGRTPTRHNILTAVNWLVSDTIPGDVLIFYFSGHGVQLDNMSGWEGEGYDEAFLPQDWHSGPEVNALQAITLKNLLLNVREDVQLTVILDCNGGQTIMDPAGTGGWSYIKGIKTKGLWPLTDWTNKVERASYNQKLWTSTEMSARKVRPRFMPGAEISNTLGLADPALEKPSQELNENVKGFLLAAAPWGQCAVEALLPSIGITALTPQGVSHVITRPNEIVSHGVFTWSLVTAMLSSLDRGFSVAKAPRPRTVTFKTLISETNEVTKTLRTSSGLPLLEQTAELTTYTASNSNPNDFAASFFGGRKKVVAASANLKLPYHPPESDYFDPNGAFESIKLFRSQLRSLDPTLNRQLRKRQQQQQQLEYQQQHPTAAATSAKKVIDQHQYSFPNTKASNLAAPRSSRTAKPSSVGDDHLNISVRGAAMTTDALPIPDHMFSHHQNMLKIGGLSSGVADYLAVAAPESIPSLAATGTVDGAGGLPTAAALLQHQHQQHNQAAAEHQQFTGAGAADEGGSGGEITTATTAMASTLTSPASKGGGVRGRSSRRGRGSAGISQNDRPQHRSSSRGPERHHHVPEMVTSGDGGSRQSRAQSTRRRRAKGHQASAAHVVSKATMRESRGGLTVDTSAAEALRPTAFGEDVVDSSGQLLSARRANRHHQAGSSSELQTTNVVGATTTTGGGVDSEQPEVPTTTLRDQALAMGNAHFVDQQQLGQRPGPRQGQPSKGDFTMPRLDSSGRFLRNVAGQIIESQHQNQQHQRQQQRYHVAGNHQQLINQAKNLGHLKEGQNLLQKPQLVTRTTSLPPPISSTSLIQQHQHQAGNQGDQLSSSQHHQNQGGAVVPQVPVRMATADHFLQQQHQQHNPQRPAHHPRHPQIAHRHHHVLPTSSSNQHHPRLTLDASRQQLNHSSDSIYRQTTTASITPEPTEAPHGYGGSWLVHPDRLATSTAADEKTVDIPARLTQSTPQAPPLVESHIGGEVVEAANRPSESPRRRTMHDNLQNQTTRTKPHGGPDGREHLGFLSDLRAGEGINRATREGREGADDFVLINAANDRGLPRAALTGLRRQPGSTSDVVLPPWEAVHSLTENLIMPSSGGDRRDAAIPSSSTIALGVPLEGAPAAFEPGSYGGGIVQSTHGGWQQQPGAIPPSSSPSMIRSREEAVSAAVQRLDAQQENGDQTKLLVAATGCDREIPVVGSGGGAADQWQVSQGATLGDFGGYSTDYHHHHRTEAGSGDTAAGGLVGVSLAAKNSGASAGRGARNSNSDLASQAIDSTAWQRLHPRKAVTGEPISTGAELGRSAVVKPSASLSSSHGKDARIIRASGGGARERVAAHNVGRKKTNRVSTKNSEDVNLVVPALASEFTSPSASPAGVVASQPTTPSTSITVAATRAPPQVDQYTTTRQAVVVSKSAAGPQQPHTGTAATPAPPLLSTQIDQKRLQQHTQASAGSGQGATTSGGLGKGDDIVSVGPPTYGPEATVVYRTDFNKPSPSSSSSSSATYPSSSPRRAEAPAGEPVGEAPFSVSQSRADERRVDGSLGFVTNPSATGTLRHGSHEEIANQQQQKQEKSKVRAGKQQNQPAARTNSVVLQATTRSASSSKGGHNSRTTVKSISGPRVEHVASSSAAASRVQPSPRRSDYSGGSTTKVSPNAIHRGPSRAEKPGNGPAVVAGGEAVRTSEAIADSHSSSTRAKAVTTPARRRSSEMARSGYVVSRRPSTTAAGGIPSTAKEGAALRGVQRERAGSALSVGSGDGRKAVASRLTAGAGRRTGRGEVVTRGLSPNVRGGGRRSRSVEHSRSAEVNAPRLGGADVSKDEAWIAAVGQEVEDALEARRKGSPLARREQDKNDSAGLVNRGRVEDSTNGVAHRQEVIENGLRAGLREAARTSWGDYVITSPRRAIRTLGSGPQKVGTRGPATSSELLRDDSKLRSTVNHDHGRSGGGVRRQYREDLFGVEWTAASPRRRSRDHMADNNYEAASGNTAIRRRRAETKTSSVTHHHHDALHRRSNTGISGRPYHGAEMEDNDDDDDDGEGIAGDDRHFQATTNGNRSGSEFWNGILVNSAGNGAIQHFGRNHALGGDPRGNTPASPASRAERLTRGVDDNRHSSASDVFVAPREGAGSRMRSPTRRETAGGNGKRRLERGSSGAMGAVIGGSGGDSQERGVANDGARYHRAIPQQPRGTKRYEAARSPIPPAGTSRQQQGGGSSGKAAVGAVKHYHSSSYKDLLGGALGVWPLEHGIQVEGSGNVARDSSRGGLLRPNVRQAATHGGWSERLTMLGDGGGEGHQRVVGRRVGTERVGGARGDDGTVPSASSSSGKQQQQRKGVQRLPLVAQQKAADAPGRNQEHEDHQVSRGGVLAGGRATRERVDSAVGAGGRGSGHRYYGGGGGNTREEYRHHTRRHEEVLDVYEGVNSRDSRGGMVDRAHGRGKGIPSDLRDDTNDVMRQRHTRSPSSTSRPRDVIGDHDDRSAAEEDCTGREPLARRPYAPLTGLTGARPLFYDFSAPTFVAGEVRGR